MDSKKIIIVVVAIVLIAGTAYFIFNGNQNFKFVKSDKLNYVRIYPDNINLYYQCEYKNEKIYKLVEQYLKHDLDEIQRVTLIKDGGGLIDEYVFGPLWQGKKIDPYKDMVINCKTTTKKVVEDKARLYIANAGQKSDPKAKLFFEPYAHRVIYNRCKLDGKTIYKLSWAPFADSVFRDFIDSKGNRIAHYDDMIAIDPEVEKTNSEIIKRVKECVDISRETFSQETGLTILTDILTNKVGD